MKKIIMVLIMFAMAISPTFAARIIPVPANVKLPAKYTQEYIDYITEEYKTVTNNQLVPKGIFFTAEPAAKVLLIFKFSLSYLL